MSFEMSLQMTVVYDTFTTRYGTRSNLSVFNFESHDIRFVGTAEVLLWIASDICNALAISDTSQALERLDDDEKLIRTLHVSGQGRETLCINESGL
ncbi:Bro-N domain-containing protein [Nostoc sp. NMS9]|uniref:BRO-N domain-containing protein n=1 Tax=Nostoc sp. NMS9 TaxID=2815393 RepID=UPI0025E15D04|nr:Bro-N domain-containing protein [Nostoc sp. NMS9]MBN3944113.1 Bro-N domain-containing protein [Nostoc sp. NMS9]